MNRLALDLGTKTGWASYVDGTVQSGVQDFSLKKCGDAQGRLVAFQSWLHRMLIVVQPGAVAYELALHRGGPATRVLVGFETIVKLKCAAHGVDECVAVHPKTLKKFATGNGDAPKKDMILAALEYLGEHHPDALPKELGDDEADALCLLFWSLEEWSEDELATDSER